MNSKNFEKEVKFTYVVKLGNFFLSYYELKDEKINKMELITYSYGAYDFKKIEEAILISDQIKGEIIKKTEIIERTYKYEEVLFF